MAWMTIAISTDQLHYQSNLLLNGAVIAALLLSTYAGISRADPLLRQLVIRAGYAPMILQRAFYDRHDAFAPARQAEGHQAVHEREPPCAMQ